MPKTKTVVVDAEALKKAIEWTGQAALDSCDDEDADELYELTEALAPIVPTLPEGWAEVTAWKGRICVGFDGGSAVNRAHIWESGMSAEITYADGRAAESSVIHPKIATYLLARFQALQGGDNE